MTEDILGIVLQKRELADYYFDNYRKYYEAENYSKASEFLWGALNNLFFAIGLFYGRKIGKHNEVIIFLNELATEQQSDKMIEQMRAAERIHANFFHNFMTKDMFEDDKNKTLKLLDTLYEILDIKIRDFNEI